MSHTSEFNDERRQALAGRSNIGPVGLLWARQAPKNWKITTLQRLFTVSSGDFLSPGDLQEDGYPVFGGNGFRGYFSNINCPPNTMLIGRYGALCGNVHIPSEPFWATEHAFRVRPLLQYHQPFVARYVEALALRHLAARAAQPGLNSRMVREQAIALPDLATQREIADFLDRETARIDLLIEKKQRLVALLGEKYDAAIAHFVTKGVNANVRMKHSGEDWLGEIPAHWDVVPPTALFTESKERAHEGDEMLSATQKYGVIPLAEFEALEKRQVTKAFTNLEKRKHVEIGDFVISMRSMDGGLERAHATGSVRSSYSVLKAGPEVNGRFFGAVLKSSLYIQALRLTSNFIRDGQDMNFGHFRKVRLPKPPIGEQAEIANLLDEKTTRLKSLASKANASVALLKEYRSALITAAVAGQIDVQTYARSGTTDRRLDAIQEEMNA